MTPRIVVITPSTLEGLGLTSLLARIMPQAEILHFGSVEEMKRGIDPASAFHFFVSSRTLMDDTAFFFSQPRTIVLTHGPEQLPLRGLHTLDVQQSEQEIITSILRLAQHGHAASHHAQEKDSPLTPRETEVLRLVVEGKINKEIADALSIGITTVITHRKNLTRKLGMRSVGALTVYAVTHGLVRVEDIRGEFK